MAGPDASGRPAGGPPQGEAPPPDSGEQVAAPAPGQAAASPPAGEQAAPLAAGQAAAPPPGADPPPGARPALAARLRRLPLPARVAAALLAAAAIVLIVLLATGGTASLPGVAPAPAASLADPVPYDGRTPQQAPGAEQRVLVQFRRPALGDLPNARSMGAAEQIQRIKSLKRELIATRGAIQANGIELKDVVSFYRVWNGFAATVKTSDLGRLNSAGNRVRTVRRLYPAAGEPVPVPGRVALPAPPAPGQPPVAILDTGMDSRALAGFADAGYDAVDRDRRPDPGRDPGGSKRVETSATALAGVVAAAGERVLPIRVASLRATGQSVEAAATTDTLLAGLERAVDPNGDGDTSDHVPVVLSGVNSPYAGFANSPEAQAVEGAAGLGTLVVAPAGNEGAAKAGGTIGSPAGAPDAVAVGALAGPEAAPRVTLKAGGDEFEAAVLGGTPPRSATTAGPVSGTDEVALGKLQTALRGKLVIVRAGDNPGAQAAAAAAVGAAAVLLADPRSRPLPAIAAGRAGAPVIGVTGTGARTLLALKPGSPVTFGETQRGARSEEPERRASLFTSEGPSAGGLPKPDLAAPGSAVTVGVGGEAVVDGGTAIAAAQVAAAASRLARAHPELSPQQLRAALIAAADPAGLPPERAGAGSLRTPSASPGITADPPAAVSGRALDPVTVRLSTQASVTVALHATGGATVSPPTLALTPGVPADVTIRLPRAGTAYGVLTATAGAQTLASVPWLVRPPEVAPVAIGPLRVSGRRVRFTVGEFTRGDPLGSGATIGLAERLILDVVGGGETRELTVPGGARDLMPAEYAYTLPAGALPPGSYRFRVRAWAPRQQTPTVRESR